MEFTTWLAVEIAFACMSVTFIYLFMRAFLKEHSDIHTALKLFVILLVLVERFVSSIFLNEYAIIISSISVISAFIIGMVCFRARVFEVGLAAAFSIVAAISSELLAVFTITSFYSIHFSYIMENNIYQLQGRVLLYLIYLVMIILVNLFRNVHIDTISTKLTLALCVLPIASILVVQQFVMHIVDLAYMPSISEIIPLFSIITVNIFIFILVENLMKQNEKNRELMLIEFQNITQQQHINEFLNTYEQVKQMVHDFKHQVGILYALSEEGKHEELSLRLSELSNLSHRPLVVNTGNFMLDAILSTREEEARKHGIELKARLEIEPNLPYISTELCVLLCNGFDNAIEACNRSVNKNKVIDMELTANAFSFMFKMRNTLGEKPETKGGIFISKKKEKIWHGVGIQSMKQSCKKLGGHISYNYDNEYFMLRLYIPFKGLIAKNDVVHG